MHLLECNSELIYAIGNVTVLAGWNWPLSFTVFLSFICHWQNDCINLCYWWMCLNLFIRQLNNVSVMWLLSVELSVAFCMQSPDWDILLFIFGMFFFSFCTVNEICSCLNSVNILMISAFHYTLVGNLEGKRGDYQNWSVLCSVPQLYTSHKRTHYEQLLQMF